MNNTEVVIDK